MTEIKRYDCDACYDRGMYEHSDGVFVAYEDHAAIVAALQEQVRALAAESAALARYFSASSVAVNHWNSWADTEDKLAFAPATPATDAALLDVREQAVNGFSEFCGDNSVFIKETCNYDSLADAACIYLPHIREGEQP